MSEDKQGIFDQDLGDDLFFLFSDFCSLTSVL
jgi:hypothetical protein